MAFLLPSAAGAGEARLDGPIASEVRRVIDGDTIEVVAQIWPSMEVTTKVRLDAVDTPEIQGAQCPRERELGDRALTFVEQRIAGRPVLLRDIRHGKYAGRVVARVELGDADLGAALIEAGLASPYGRKEGRQHWCEPALRTSSSGN